MEGASSTPTSTSFSDNLQVQVVSQEGFSWINMSYPGTAYLQELVFRDTRIEELVHICRRVRAGHEMYQAETNCPKCNPQPNNTMSDNQNNQELIDPQGWVHVQGELGAYNTISTGKVVAAGKNAQHLLGEYVDVESGAYVPEDMTVVPIKMGDVTVIPNPSDHNTLRPAPTAFTQSIPLDLDIPQGTFLAVHSKTGNDHPLECRVIGVGIGRINDHGGVSEAPVELEANIIRDPNAGIILHETDNYVLYHIPLDSSYRILWED